MFLDGDGRYCVDGFELDYSFQGVFLNVSLSHPPESTSLHDRPCSMLSYPFSGRTTSSSMPANQLDCTRKGRRRTFLLSCFFQRYPLLTTLSPSIPLARSPWTCPCNSSSLALPSPSSSSNASSSPSSSKFSNPLGIAVEPFLSEIADNPPAPGVDTWPGDGGFGKGWEEEAMEEVSESLPDVTLW